MSARSSLTRVLHAAHTKVARTLRLVGVPVGGRQIVAERVRSKRRERRTRVVGKGKKDSHEQEEQEDCAM